MADSGPMVREVGAGETGSVHAAMAALRPHHGDRQAFVARVDRDLRPQGYRLLGAFADGSAEAVGVLGFRPQALLHLGDTLYVDDLSVLPAGRRRGVATALLDAVAAEGRRLGCSAVTLDSGYQRRDAHALYLRYGFAIVSHHFALGLE
jgi:GNAT superfamily N-acetyltransferase